jgi:hypothetical protein
MTRSTKVGTASTTAYMGGSCHGADFDSSGATESSTGAIQFVLSEGRRHNDILVTQLTSPTNSIGSFSLSATDLKQIKQWDTPERIKGGAPIREPFVCQFGRFLGISVQLPR